MTMPRSILVLSSSLDAMEAALQTLGERGVEVRRAGGVYHFVAQFASDPPDMAIVDCEGFRKQEIDMLRMLRQMRPAAGLIVLVERDQREIASGALEVGADLYLLKPPGTAELLAAVERAGLRRELAEALASGGERGEILADFAVGATQRINNALTVLSGNLQEVARHLNSEGSVADEINALAAIRENLPNLVHEAAVIETVSRQLLQLARMKPAATDRVNVLQVITDLMQTHAAACKQKGIELTAELPRSLPQVIGDRARINDALEAVLKDAVSAVNGRNGRITISCRARDHGVEMVLQDNGPYIPTDKLSGVCNPELPPPRANGTEMGLAMACSIIRLLGGSMEVQSDPSPLTRFIIWLPAAH